MSYKSYWDDGNWLALCDSCGRKFKASTLQKRWDNLMVCEQDFEMRQPQDFVRGAVDIIAVPWARSEPTDTFVSVGCTPMGISALADDAVADCSICM